MNTNKPDTLVFPQKNTTLKHIILRHNYFEERGAHHFKDALSTNESLETMDLSWNRFRTRSAMLIAEGIQASDWHSVQQWFIHSFLHSLFRPFAHSFIFFVILYLFVEMFTYSFFIFLLFL